MEAKEWASMCDMTAGWAVEGHSLVLEIGVPTKTVEEHEKVGKAIKAAIEKCGYNVSWIPSM